MPEKQRVVIHLGADIDDMVSYPKTANVARVLCGKFVKDVYASGEFVGMAKYPLRPMYWDDEKYQCEVCPLCKEKFLGLS